MARESWFPGRPELAVFSVHFRKGSKPTSVGWLYPFIALKKYIIVGVKYIGEKATSAFTVSICPLQDSQLYPAVARAGCKLGSHACPWWAANAAVPCSRDIRWHADKMEILFCLDVGTNVWYFLIFLLIRTTMLRLEKMTSHLKAEYAMHCLFLVD